MFTGRNGALSRGFVLAYLRKRLLDGNECVRARFPTKVDFAIASRAELDVAALEMERSHHQNERELCEAGFGW